nr:MAG TPA: holin [Caudoviricetes sp.]
MDKGIYVAIVAGAIVFDLISGLLKAFANKTVSTTVMRQGLYHKSAILLVVLLAIGCEYVTAFIDLGFTFDGKLTAGVTTIICLMEIMSILENLADINPDIKASKIMSFFSSSKIEQKNEQKKNV